MKRLAAHYRDAAIFVYPSIAEKGETFGLAPLEAMAFGCVPVVSQLACFKDFIEDGHNGVIFDHRASIAAQLLGDHVRKLVEDADHRGFLANNAKCIGQSHHPARMAAQFLEDFERIVGNFTECPKKSL